MEHITEVTGMALEGGGVELLSARIHENQAATRQGFENAVPMSVAGLAAYASTDERAQELLGTLRRGNYPHLSPGEVMEPEAARTAQSSRGLLARIFGGRLDEVVNRLAAQSSVSRSSASMLLGMAAPLVLDAIGKEVKARNLDAHGLSRFLADEGRRASAALPESLSGMVGGTMIGEVPSVEPPFDVRGGVVERVDDDYEVREQARRAEREARERRRAGAIGPRRGWWIPLALVLGALAVVGLIVYLVSRAGSREGRSIRQIMPEGVAPSGRMAPSEPPAVEPRGQFTAPPVTEPPAAEAQPKAPSAAPPVTEPPAAEAQPAAPSTAKPAEGEPAEEKPPEAKPPEAMTPASPEGAAGELSGFLAGNEATPHRIPLTGIEFAVGSAELSDSGMLDQVAEVLAQHPEAKIRVEGHTDPTGGQARNRALSRERADAVKDHLVAHGVAARQIEASGKASSDPIGSNDSASGRAQNRRVDLVVIER